MKNIVKIILMALILFSGFQYFKYDPSMAGKTMNTENNSYKVATFAGGCFWCTESDFEKVEGVVDVISGYIGGHEENPTYKEVSAGITGHAEAIKVTYDSGKVNYSQLLEVFWRHVDPTDPGGQFVDRGSQYRSAIFYHDEEQKRLAEESKKKLNGSGRFKKPIVTEIVSFDRFYPAENYHQDYYKKSPLRYKVYRFHSGRDQFLKKVWQDSKETISGQSSSKYVKPDDEQLRKNLSPIQYQVTQHDGTEPPFKNEYWDNKQEGLYVDIVSGEPLFSSTDKFKSGTGWPSFTQPLEPGNIIEKEDRSFFMTRIEVRSRHGDSHLGHVFPDGPKPTGLRYCINSASLRFVAREDLEKEGYGEFSKLFESH